MSSTPVADVIPTHLGIILDGNRRWANANGLSLLEGHRKGAEVFKDIALGTFDRGVKYLSAFVWSTENWSRTEEEVSYIMGLVVKGVEDYLDSLHKEGVRVIVLGRRDGLRRKVLEAIRKTEEKTRDNTRGTLALCFNYGGQEEIVDAFKTLVARGISENEVSAEAISKALYAPDMPPIDLLIRTSGEQRTSGYMMWRADYAELHFNDKLWPDFTPGDLDVALADFSKRKRRFGA